MDEKYTVRIVMEIVRESDGAKISEASQEYFQRPYEEVVIVQEAVVGALVGLGKQRVEAKKASKA